MSPRLLLSALAAIIPLMLSAQQQVDTYLSELTKSVKELRKANAATREHIIATLTADKSPKITLMDELRWAGSTPEKDNAAKGNKANRFKLNQVVAHVYKQQNQQMESKSAMLNGNEKDIHYAVIEKSVKRGGQLVYGITGRSGQQEFMFVPFNPNTSYVVEMTCGSWSTKKTVTGDCQISLKSPSYKVPIFFSISYPEEKSNKDLVESFAIINYNPQN